jgi:hypothetical protein
MYINDELYLFKLGLLLELKNIPQSKQKNNLKTTIFISMGGLMINEDKDIHFYLMMKSYKNIFIYFYFKKNF